MTVVCLRIHRGLGKHFTCLLHLKLTPRRFRVSENPGDDYKNKRIHQLLISGLPVQFFTRDGNAISRNYCITISCKMSMGSVNFCRTFISSISLFLDLAGSNLAQTVLNPLKSIRLCLFLLGVSAVFENAKECSFHNRIVSIKPMTQLTRFDDYKVK